MVGLKITPNEIITVFFRVKVPLSKEALKFIIGTKKDYKNDT